MLTVFATDGVAQEPANGNDPLRLVLQAYTDAVRELRDNNLTVEERIRFRGEWRERLLSAARANANSEYFKAALMKVVGLSNGLGDTAMANAIAIELEQIERDPISKARWRGEQAEIARQTFKNTADGTSRNEAILAFRDTLSLLAQANELSRSGEIQQVTYQIMLAEMITSDSASAAIELLNAAIDNLSRNSSLSNELRELGFGLERACMQLVEAYILIGNDAGVNDALEVLSTESGLRQELWVTILASAAKLYPASGEKQLAFLNRWKHVNRSNELRSPMLLFHIARLEYQLELLVDAVRDYEHMRDNYKEFFLKRDENALVSERGGHYAEILINLGDCYARLGLIDKAKASYLVAEQIVTKDPRLPFLQSAISASEVAAVNADSKVSTGTVLHTTGARVWIFLAIGVLAIIVYFMIRVRTVAGSGE
jgi:tetratricopeptide (TPR) repeat protein